MKTTNNKKTATNETVETVETIVNPIEKLQNEIEAMSVTDAIELFNRLPLETLEKIQAVYAGKAKENLNKVEKEILTARNMELTDLNINAMSWLLKQPDADADELKTLKNIYFDNIFLSAIAAVQPSGKAGKAEKHNGLSHHVKLLITRFSYQKEANVDNFNFQAVQPLELLTLADFEKHCMKNTFANNTEFPVIIDGESFADKASAVEAMASKMFAWYIAAIGNSADIK